uniref:Uncharacterized protein n=1 Tax=Megaselia scalaris TaxID=36166 RepID=T1GYI8_MEGSC
SCYSGWINSFGLDIHLDKSELVLFTRRHKPTKLSTPKIGGYHLSARGRVRELKDLSPPKLTYWIFKAIVRPIVMYGALFWWGFIVFHWIRFIGVCITSAIKSTSLDSILAILARFCDEYMVNRRTIRLLSIGTSKRNLM